MRYTRKFIQARFEIAMKEAGLPTGPSWVDGKAQIGVHSIDFNSGYGGYTIRAIANEGGAESCPYGMERYTASEFVALLEGIRRTAEILKGRA